MVKGGSCVSSYVKFSFLEAPQLEKLNKIKEVPSSTIVFLIYLIANFLAKLFKSLAIKVAKKEPSILNTIENGRFSH